MILPYASSSRLTSAFRSFLNGQKSDSQIAKGCPPPKKGVIYPQIREKGQRMAQNGIFPIILGKSQNWPKSGPKPEIGASEPYRSKFPYIFLVLARPPIAHRGSIFANLLFSNSGTNFNEMGSPDKFRKNPVLEPPSD